MREISVHEDDEVARAVCQPVDIGAAKTELARACMQLELVAVDFLQLADDVLGAVRGVVIDDNNLKVDVLLFGGLEKKVSDDGQVVTFLVGRHENRVLVPATARFHH